MVGTGGRVFVPKKVVEQVGILGKDGLLRIEAGFSARGGAEGWKDVSAHIYAPRSNLADAPSGRVDPEQDFGYYDEDRDIRPENMELFNWDT